MINTARIKPLRALTELECLRLLATSNVGRLAITQDALPALVPVQVRLEANHLLITSLLGSAVPLHKQGVVTLETGNLGEGVGREWSVEVCGMLRREIPSTLGADEAGLDDGFQLSTRKIRGWSR
ncbi:MAG TPA: pyridoxamine 5'-phosphate oxidase family protein [Acidimicrobiales bacterium]